MELPALDNRSDVRVQAQVQSLDVVVNVEWLLELVKFLVPSNAVNMSAYEEKAYNLVTALRNGDANVASTIMKNRGFSLDVSLQPINVIIPDSCSRTARRRTCCCASWARLPSPRGHGSPSPTRRSSRRRTRTTASTWRSTTWRSASWAGGCSPATRASRIW